MNTKINLSKEMLKNVNGLMVNFTRVKKCKPD